MWNYLSTLSSIIVVFFSLNFVMIYPKLVENTVL